MNPDERPRSPRPCYGHSSHSWLHPDFRFPPGCLRTRSRPRLVRPGLPRLRLWTSSSSVAVVPGRTRPRQCRPSSRRLPGSELGYSFDRHRLLPPSPGSVLTGPVFAGPVRRFRPGGLLRLSRPTVPYFTDGPDIIISALLPDTALSQPLPIFVSVSSSPARSRPGLGSPARRLGLILAGS